MHLCFPPLSLYLRSQQSTKHELEFFHVKISLINYWINTKFWVLSQFLYLFGRISELEKRRCKCFHFSHGVDHLRNHFSGGNTVVLHATEWPFLFRGSTRKGAGLKRQGKEKGRLKAFVIVASFFSSGRDGVKRKERRRFIWKKNKSSFWVKESRKLKNVWNYSFVVRSKSMARVNWSAGSAVNDPEMIWISFLSLTYSYPLIFFNSFDLTVKN